MSKPTRTVNRLHFNDLDPMRFEDLCLNIISRLNNLKDLKHYGRKGSDDGVDIHAVVEENDIQKNWHIQCKRYTSISKNDFKNIIDKIVLNNEKPDKLLIITSCDINKASHDFISEYSRVHGIKEIETWTASILESKLYKDYKDLLFVYFGVRIENKSVDNATKIRYSLRMEKRVGKELIDHKYIKDKNDYHYFIINPWRKFITEKVIIRSVDDILYPKNDLSNNGKISPWFKTFFYNLYHNGIELWLDAGMGQKIIMDNNNYWEPVRYDDKRLDNPKYKVMLAKTIGRIPYFNIVDFKAEGDQYFMEPHLFCKFNINGEPYEEIYYRSYDNSQLGDWEFVKEKQTTFMED